MGFYSIWGSILFSNKITLVLINRGIKQIDHLLNKMPV
jgi:hypothetical protein